MVDQRKKKIQDARSFNYVSLFMGLNDSCSCASCQLRGPHISSTPRNLLVHVLDPLLPLCVLWFKIDCYPL